MDAKQRLNVYVAQSRQYFENALSFLDKGETGKASELLWGSVAQAVKAVAASQGRHLSSHGELWQFVRELAKNIKDPSLITKFAAVDRLHRDFYETELRAEDLAALVVEIRPMVRDLLDMIPGV